MAMPTTGPTGPARQVEALDVTEEQRGPAPAEPAAWQLTTQTSIRGPRPGLTGPALTPGTSALGSGSTIGRATSILFLPIAASDQTLASDLYTEALAHHAEVPMAGEPWHMTAGPSGTGMIVPGAQPVAGQEAVAVPGPAAPAEEIMEGGPTLSAGQLRGLLDARGAGAPGTGVAVARAPGPALPFSPGGRGKGQMLAEEVPIRQQASFIDDLAGLPDRGDQSSGVMGEDLVTTCRRARAWFARKRIAAARFGRAEKPAVGPVTAEAQAAAGPAEGKGGEDVAAADAARARTKEYDADEHKLSVAELCDRFKTSIDAEHPAKSMGLSPGEAAARLATHGRNVLTPPPTTPEWIKFLRQFTNLLIVLLIIAAGLGFLAFGLFQGTGQTGATDNLILACALLAIVVLTCIMAYWQEKQAGNVIASIQGMLPTATKVIRGGHEISVPADQLVPGDIVHLTIGNRIPADIRVLSANDFKVEMASLTGESDAIECGPEKRSDLPAEARNLIFNSSLVMNGDCIGVVYRTGDNTMIGTIAGMAGGGRARRTTMEMEIHRLVIFIACAAVTTAIIFFIIGLSRGFGIVFSFVNAFILVLVANVPEGLPASVTSILTLSARSLATHNVFIKRTDLIETLGCASVICSDKTGTLTQNKMTVSQLWFDGVVVNARARIRKVSGPATRGGVAPAGLLAAPSPGAAPGRPAAAAAPAAPVAAAAAEAPSLEERDVAAEMTIGRGMSLIGGTMFIHALGRGPGARGPPSSPALLPGPKERRAGAFSPTKGRPTTTTAIRPTISFAGREAPPAGLPAPAELGVRHAASEPPAALAAEAGARLPSHAPGQVLVSATDQTALPPGAAMPTAPAVPLVAGLDVTELAQAEALQEAEGRPVAGVPATGVAGAVQVQAEPLLATVAEEGEGVTAEEQPAMPEAVPEPAAVVPRPALAGAGTTARPTLGPGPGPAIRPMVSFQSLAPLTFARDEEHVGQLTRITGIGSMLGAPPSPAPIVPEEAEEEEAGPLQPLVGRPSPGAVEIGGPSPVAMGRTPTGRGITTTGRGAAPGQIVVSPGHRTAASGPLTLTSPQPVRTLTPAAIAVPAAPVPAAPEAAPAALEGGPGGSLGRQTSMAPGGGAAVASFQSFRGFTSASWSESNGFTRLMTIAAVCNRAKFAGEVPEEEGGEPGGAAGAAAGTGAPAAGAATAVPVGGPVPSPSGRGTTTTVPGRALPPPTGPGDATGLKDTVTMAKTSKALPQGALGLGPPGKTVGGTTTDVTSPAPQASPAIARTVTGFGAGGIPLGPTPGPNTLRSMLSFSLTKQPPKPGAGSGTGWIQVPAVDPRKVHGDASEAALLRYADNLVPVFEFRLAYPVLFEIPFNSANKWAYAVCPCPEDPSVHLAMLKGAPERIIDRCSYYLKAGREIPIDEAFKAQWAAAYERFGLSGERVLAFSYKTFAAPAGAPAVYKTDEDSRPMTGLVFAGLISLIDPPKEGVAEAVAICRAASVRVAMVTGDHPLTAEAIARKVGIITKSTAREVAHEHGVEEASIPLDDPRVQAVVLPGYALPKLSEADWDAVLSKPEVVFARTSPQQKTEIVSHYQRLGHIVAVTGDGTNDAPALKKADIGVAMGSAGASDVAREAADMVLTDDNFASIVVAITMGRTVFDNIRKTVAYTVAHAVPELLPVFVLLILDVPLMLTGLLVLTIDLLTEQWPAISLAYEPSESAVMQRPPRSLKTDRLVDGRLLRYSYIIVGISEFLICTAAFFLTTNYYGIPGSYSLNRRNNWIKSAPPLTVNTGSTFAGPQQEEVWRRGVAAFYLTLVLCQAWHVYLTKTRTVSLWSHGPFRNMQTTYGVMFAIACACFFVYVPAVQNLFNTRNPSFWPYAVSFMFPAVFIPYTEASKWMVRRNPKGWWARNMQW